MTSRATTEQLLIQVLMRALGEAVGTVADHGPDGPERMRANEELRLAFAPLWLRIPRVELRCMTDGIWWRDARVLAPDESDSALLPTLVASGIHGLTIEPGAEQAEIHRFVELLDEKARLDEHAEKDLVMMLFRADFHCIGYSITSPESTEAEPTRASPAPTTDPERLRSTVRADAAATDDRGVVQVEKFDSTLYFLDKREIEYLRSEVEKQYAQDHTRSVLALLLDTLQMQTDPRVEDEVIAAFQTFLPYLLGSGRFTSLAYLTGELKTVVRNTDLSTEQRSALEIIRLSLSEKGALTQLFLALEDGQVTPTVESLGALLRELDHAALETVLVWSGQLRRQETKTALFTALEELFRESPADLVRSLRSRDRTVLRRALAVAGRLRLPDLVEGVAGTLGHEDAGTRSAAVRVLTSISGTPAMREVARALEDENPGVRKAAYQAFLNRPYRSVAERLKKVLSSTDLEALDLSERKLLFAAFGAVAGPDGVSDLEPILAGRRVFGSKFSSETRACAALGLEQIDSRDARSALQAATEYRDPLVRSAAASALRGGS